MVENATQRDVDQVGLGESQRAKQQPAATTVVDHDGDTVLAFDDWSRREHVSSRSVLVSHCVAVKSTLSPFSAARCQKALSSTKFAHVYSKSSSPSCPS